MPTRVNVRMLPLLCCRENSKIVVVVEIKLGNHSVEGELFFFIVDNIYKVK